MTDAAPYVSRGGHKLAAALEAWGLDVTGFVCADLGCSTGGFTDCLLQRGAARVFAVDTGYGQLAWKLRQDPRVAVRERRNALQWTAEAACDLVTIDLGWTKQALAVRAALGWLTGAEHGRIVTLVKPHYESGRHVLPDADADAVTRRVLDEAMPALGVEVLGVIRSPLRGGKGGNLEHLALLRRSNSSPQ